VKNLRKILVAGVATLAVSLLAACDVSPAAPNPRAHEQAVSTQNQTNIDSKQPIPVIAQSLERANLIDRAKFLNNTTFQSCVYLFANNGSLVAFYPVKRKVSSLNSYLQSSEQLVRADLGEYNGDLVMEQPDIDGAYGKNDDGIFFFTADTGEYVEWKGDYLYTSNCSKPTQQPLVVRNIVGTK
jgi:hypothetical protein